jgi:hypothetical protein
MWRLGGGKRDNMSGDENQMIAAGQPAAAETGFIAYMVALLFITWMASMDVGRMMF